MVQASKRFRNSDKVPIILPDRDWIDANCARGRDGFVVEDLDRVHRRYGPKFSLDAKGNLFLVERKFESIGLDTSQIMTFGLLDEICRTSPLAYRYKGYFLENYNDRSYIDYGIAINGIHIPLNELAGQLMSAFPDIAPLDFTKLGYPR